VLRLIVQLAININYMGVENVKDVTPGNEDSPDAGKEDSIEVVAGDLDIEVGEGGEEEVHEMVAEDLGVRSPQESIGTEDTPEEISELRESIEKTIEDTVTPESKGRWGPDSALLDQKLNLDQDFMNAEKESRKWREDSSTVEKIANKTQLWGGIAGATTAAGGAATAASIGLAGGLLFNPITLGGLAIFAGSTAASEGLKMYRRRKEEETDKIKDTEFRRVYDSLK